MRFGEPSGVHKRAQRDRGRAQGASGNKPDAPCVVGALNNYGKHPDVTGGEIGHTRDVTC